jgi:hypothetical protein
MLSNQHTPMKTTLLQFPSGDEATLDEWKEAEEPAQEPDKFLQWEAQRSLITTIGEAMALASTQP